MFVQFQFFIESEYFPQQQVKQSFEYGSLFDLKLNSKFTITNTLKAFAVCKGVILVQPQNGAENNKVSLILSLYKQLFPGLNIVHFIYRGLQKSDLFTTNSAPKIIPSNGTVIFNFNYTRHKNKSELICFLI